MSDGGSSAAHRAALTRQVWSSLITGAIAAAVNVSTVEPPRLAAPLIDQRAELVTVSRR